MQRPSKDGGGTRTTRAGRAGMGAGGGGGRACPATCCARSLSIWPRTSASKRLPSVPHWRGLCGHGIHKQTPLPAPRTNTAASTTIPLPAQCQWGAARRIWGWDMCGILHMSTILGDRPPIPAGGGAGSMAHARALVLVLDLVPALAAREHDVCTTKAGVRRAGARRRKGTRAGDTRIVRIGGQQGCARVTSEARVGATVAPRIGSYTRGVVPSGGSLKTPRRPWAL